MKKIFLGILTLIILLSYSTIINASEKYYYVVPGGESIGLKIDMGVEIVGKYCVQTENGKVNPWKDSKIDTGDYIIEIDNNQVNNNQDLINYLKTTSKDEVILKVKRENQTYNTSIKVVTSLNKEKTIE